MSLRAGHGCRQAGRGGESCPGQSPHAPEIFPAEATARGAQATANVTIPPASMGLMRMATEKRDRFSKRKCQPSNEEEADGCLWKPLGCDQLCQLLAVCPPRLCPSGAGLEGGDPSEEGFLFLFGLHQWKHFERMAAQDAVLMCEHEM